MIKEKINKLKRKVKILEDENFFLGNQMSEDKRKQNLSIIKNYKKIIKEGEDLLIWSESIKNNDKT